MKGIYGWINCARHVRLAYKGGNKRRRSYSRFSNDIQGIQVVVAGDKVDKKESYEQRMREQSLQGGKLVDEFYTKIEKFF